MEPSRIQNALTPLVGLRVHSIRRAADLLMVHFGEFRQTPDKKPAVGTPAEWALHVQCPWRLEGPEGVVTGRMDLWECPEVGTDYDPFSPDYLDRPNLLDKMIAALLSRTDQSIEGRLHPTTDMVVEAVQADAFGGATITLSGGFRFVLFPAGSVGEEWRIFRTGPSSSHFVVRSGPAINDD